MAGGAGAVRVGRVARVPQLRLPDAPAIGGAANLPVHALLLLVVLTAAVTRQGAYYQDGQRLLGVLIAFTAAAAALARRIGAGDLRFPPAKAAAIVGGWAAVSATIAGAPGSAMPTVAMLAAVVVVLVACRRTERPARDLLAAGLVAGGAVCALSGWAGVAWRLAPLALEDQRLWRAATSLTTPMPRPPCSSRSRCWRWPGWCALRRPRRSPPPACCSPGPAPP